jgi:hypothetical protein
MKRIIVGLAALTLIAPVSHPAAAHDDVAVRFTVDVAEDFARFVPTPVNPADTEPKRGAWFLTEGRVFPKGTIQGDGSSFDPASAGAIGTWLCRGTHLISLAEILGGLSPWVATQQIYLLPDDGRMLTTDGLEGTGRFVRAVTGATGKYAGYIGEQHQQLLGFNITGGVNLRVTFVLRRAASR